MIQRWLIRLVHWQIRSNLRQRARLANLHQQLCGCVTHENPQPLHRSK
jgi:hypothetical protein